MSEIQEQFDTSVPTVPMAPPAQRPSSANGYVDPMEVGESVTTRPMLGVNRDAIRYVVMAGDLMPPATKRNFKDLPGAHLGGQHFSLSEIPALWKFQGFITRGRITPLMKNAVKAGSSEKISQERAKDIV